MTRAKLNEEKAENDCFIFILGYSSADSAFLHLRDFAYGGFHSLNAASESPAVGTMAPDFTLISESGTPVSQHDFRGKWVVLYFYPEDFTHGCTIEAHSFQRALAQYDQKNAVIVGVSLDTTGSHKELCAKEGLHFKLLADTQHKVAAMYDSQMQHGGTTVAARNTFVINPQGEVVKVFLHVDPTAHSQQALAALDGLEGSAVSQ